MGLAATIIGNVLSRFLNLFTREDFERVQMKIKRKLKIDDLSMTAGEMIVAILENEGAVLKTAEGLCVNISEKTAPFKSNIPPREKAPDDDVITELCDRGLVRAYNDKLYCATEKAKNNVEELKRLDERRVFLYAPELVKSLFRFMVRDDSYFRVILMKDGFVHVEIRDEKKLLIGKRVPRQTAEEAIEYMNREKLIEGVWVVDENDAALIKCGIRDKFNLNSVTDFFGEDFCVRFAGEFSPKGRRVASINLRNLNQK